MMKLIFLYLCFSTIRAFSSVNINAFVGSHALNQQRASWVPIEKLSSKSIPHINSISSSQNVLYQSATSTEPPSSIATNEIPRISSSDIQSLSTNGYVVIPNFLSSELVSALREDVQTLRSPPNNKFKVARIGQDSTNALNTDIRIAETCFIGANKMELSQIPNDARETLYVILDKVREDLSGNPVLDTFSSEHHYNTEMTTGEKKELIQCAPALDSKLTELLYAYYPEGGFYRRHRDAIVGSASILRSYSLLLYINDMKWNENDGGSLRMHLDSGLDFLPEGEKPNFVDVTPNGGTLVLFKSEKIPHEVLDTKATRAAVVGWYNRAVTAADIQNLSSGEEDTMRSAMLLVAAGLITAGLASIILGS